MAERWTYDSIIWANMKRMYKARRNIVRRNRGWIHPTEDVGIAFHDDTPDEYLPIMPDLYRLMEEVIYLILSAGTSPKLGVDLSTNIINEILEKTPLDELVAGIPEDEERELRIDLEILGFIPPDITKPQFAR